MPWISEKVLIRQLKELEQDGVVKRHDYGEVPPRVDYRLTDYGLSVLPLMQTLADWGKTHLEQSNS
jgi:DNA-binding HxlR family transcriptional regulator